MPNLPYPSCHDKHPSKKNTNSVNGVVVAYRPRPITKRVELFYFKA